MVFFYGGYAAFRKGGPGVGTGCGDGTAKEAGRGFLDFDVLGDAGPAELFPGAGLAGGGGGDGGIRIRIRSSLLFGRGGGGGGSAAALNVAHLGRWCRARIGCHWYLLPPVAGVAFFGRVGLARAETTSSLLRIDAAVLF